MTDSTDSHIVQQMQDLLLDWADESIIIIDASMTVRWVNTSALRLSGKMKHEIIGHDYREIEHKIFKSGDIHSGILEATHSGKPFYFELPIDLISPVLLKIVPSKSGWVALILKAVNDWQHIYDAINYPSMILDARQRVIASNAAAKALFGNPSANQLYNQHCYDMLQECKPVVARCSEESTHVSDDEVVESEFELKGHIYKISCREIKNGSAIQKRLYVATDITSKRTAEDAANLYLDVIAHDIANHLQIILFGVSSLVDDMSNQALQLVLLSINRITRLIAKARAIEGLESSRLYPVILNDVLLPMVAEFKINNPTVKFTVISPSENCVVLANSFLSELITNLLDNAIRHNTKEEKMVWVYISQVQDGWEVAISDNGDGILSTQKESLLDGARRFGGIGIHQAKLIARRFGASITIRDRINTHPEEGAEFAVWFPKVK